MFDALSSGSVYLLKNASHRLYLTSDGYFPGNRHILPYRPVLEGRNDTCSDGCTCRWSINLCSSNDIDMDIIITHIKSSDLSDHRSRVKYRVFRHAACSIVESDNTFSLLFSRIDHGFDLQGGSYKPGN